MNRQNFTLLKFVGLLLLIPLLIGCEEISLQTPPTDRRAANADAAEKAAAEKAAQPDLQMIEDLTSRLRDKYPMDLFYVGGGDDDKLAWNSDVKKTDSLVDPIQATITFENISMAQYMRKKGETGFSISFTYSWKGGSWVPLALGTTSTELKDNGWIQGNIGRMVQYGDIPDAFIDSPVIPPANRQEMRHLIRTKGFTSSR